MGKKKKIRRLVDAVQHLFASPLDRKKLRKASAFEQFLDELKMRQTELLAQFDTVQPGSEAEAELAADLDTVGTQIVKAERLLIALREE